MLSNCPVDDLTTKNFNDSRFSPSADQSDMAGFVMENGGSSTQPEAAFSCGSAFEEFAGVSGVIFAPKDATVGLISNPRDFESCKQQDIPLSSLGAVGLMPLDRLIIDLSIIEALAEIDLDVAKRVEYDFELSDDGLLPLSRIDSVLRALDCDLPPIDVVRAGSAYKVVNGRHRVLRALLLGKRFISTGHEDFIRSGGESNPGPPKPVNKPVKQHGKKNERKKIINQIEGQLNVFHDTRIYTRGRDNFYPDALALARFNTWVEAHEKTIDPQEQFVCTVCGHVGFVLCAHKITQVEIQIQEDEELVAEDHRHHKWSLPIQKIASRAFKWPAFDTHSADDEFIAGISNEHLNKDLVILELFSYIVLHQQTSYLVNGREDRALKLAHSHRLAEKWLISSNKEKLAENDLHFSVRVRFTVQRACDNLQNSMLYEYRYAAWNFGWAWLPKSRFYLLMVFLIMVLGICLCVLTLLSWVGTVLPVVLASGTRTSTPLFGNMPKFTCAGHISCPALNVMGDAFVVTQSCEFTDWVMEMWNVVLCRFWELLSLISEQYQTRRIGVCLDLRMATDTLWGLELMPEALLQVVKNQAGHSYYFHVGVLKLKSYLYYISHC